MLFVIVYFSIFLVFVYCMIYCAALLFIYCSVFYPVLISFLCRFSVIVVLVVCVVLLPVGVIKNNNN